MRNKIFTKIIITTLLVALLTFNVGKVTRVSAVGTTIAGAAAASLCAVGIIYCSYMALTGAAIHVPNTVENIQTWLSDMGNKVIQYPSGREAYEELYPQFIGIGDEPLHSILDKAWTWTSQKLKSWANDFSSTAVIENIATFENVIDNTYTPTNGFAYPLNTMPNVIYANGDYYNFNDWCSSRGVALQSLTGELVYISSSGTLTKTDLPAGTYRNYYTDGLYYPQILVNEQWINLNDYVNGFHGGFKAIEDALNYFFGYIIAYNENYYMLVGTDYLYNIPSGVTYPVLANQAIYDAELDAYRPLVIPQDYEIVKNPQWPTLPPDHDNKPVIPYVKLPFDPNWINPVTNVPGGGNWGFNLANLLDKLEDLAGLMIEIGAIAELINQFKDLLTGQTGDDYYIYYDDSEHNETFYNYYTITNFNGDVYQYDINVSDADEHLPVDLNTISVYTQNRYLEQIKDSAIAGSSMLRDLAVFWYDVDPEVTYIVLGCCILVLIGAFTGKLGHS